MPLQSIMSLKAELARALNCAPSAHNKVMWQFKVLA